MRFLLVGFALFFVLVAAGERKSQKDRGRNEPHCGLPPFTDHLPDQAREKVYNIWERYEEGDECEGERADTKKILEALDPHVRRQVLSRKGPAFLNGASPEVKKEFENLWRNRTIPRAEKPEKFKALAEKLLNPIQMKEFKKFHQLMEQRRAEFRRRLAILSPEARAAHQKLSELREQKLKIYVEMTEDARKELSNLYRGSNFDRSP